MTDEIFKSSYVGLDGMRHEVSLKMSDYEEAAQNNRSLGKYYALKYPTKEGQPSMFQQVCAQAGIRVRSIPEQGIQASSLKEILSPSLGRSMEDQMSDAKQAGVIIRPDGTDRHGVAGRFLFPEVLLQMTEAALRDNPDPYMVPWENAIAVKTSINSERADRPLIDVTAPESSEEMPIAQGAEPASMISISLSERSYRIPTKAIGIKFTDQSRQYATIDKIGITLAAQARGSRRRRIHGDMAAIINGDVDRGITALTVVNASTFDSTIPGTNFFTHKAWVKWLRDPYLSMSITHVLCDIDAGLAIEDRVGRPTVYTDISGQENRFPANYTVENLGMPTPTLLIVPTSIIGANIAMGFDSSVALEEITNVAASYSAIEEFVIRRITEMRFDYGVALFKFFDDAFRGIQLGA